MSKELDGKRIVGEDGVSYVQHSFNRDFEDEKEDGEVLEIKPEKKSSASEARESGPSLWDEKENAWEDLGYLRKH